MKPPLKAPVERLGLATKKLFGVTSFKVISTPSSSGIQISVNPLLDITISSSEALWSCKRGDGKTVNTVAGG